MAKKNNQPIVYLFDSGDLCDWKYVRKLTMKGFIYMYEVDTSSDMVGVVFSKTPLTDKQAQAVYREDCEVEDYSVSP